MKIYDCSCGAIPQIEYVNTDILEYVVICSVCRKKTPVCASLRRAVTLWNQTHGGDLPSEMESA
jgi:hypothetical protein